MYNNTILADLQGIEPSRQPVILFNANAFGEHLRLTDLFINQSGRFVRNRTLTTTTHFYLMSQGLEACSEQQIYIFTSTFKNWRILSETNSK